MPGAPNRPPEIAPHEATTADLPTDAAERKVLRRLAPARVALRLDLWKGNPSPELLVPFEKAEGLFASRDFVNADSALDQLAVRFAEPRWPTLPEPFRSLRVTIVQPQPPHWDPEFKMTPEERDVRRTRRTADTQLALAKAVLDWASAHGSSTDDLAPILAAAQQELAGGTATDAFWDRVDTIWVAVRGRVSPPARKASPPVPPAPPAEP